MRVRRAPTRRREFRIEGILLCVCMREKVLFGIGYEPSCGMFR